MEMTQSKYLTLIVAVTVAGVSQGLLLSLLAIILENQGVSSSWNSFNALALYVGILLATPFLEYPLRRFGYKPMLLIGIALVMIGTLFFPVWQNIFFWMGLRFLVGVGDTTLHFAIQTWIISTAQPNERGRKISFYGFAYGLGFGIGPLGINLLSIHIWAPFLALVIFYLIVGGFVLRINNAYPDTQVSEESGKREGPQGGSSMQRYKKIIQWGWFALIPPFLFGYLESSLNNNFPVYALREGITKEWVSILLPAFVIGSLIFQIPLGILSDRMSRKKILVSVMFLGSIGFGFVPFLGDKPWFLFVVFIFLGGFVGSTFSLGIAYGADLLPANVMASFNILASVLFGIASMLGAYMNGLFIQFLDGNYMFYVISGIYLFASILGLLFQGQINQKEEGALWNIKEY